MCNHKQRVEWGEQVVYWDGDDQYCAYAQLAKRAGMDAAWKVAEYDATCKWIGREEWEQLVLEHIE